MDSGSDLKLKVLVCGTGSFPYSYYLLQTVPSCCPFIVVFLYYLEGFMVTCLLSRISSVRDDYLGPNKSSE